MKNFTVSTKLIKNSPNQSVKISRTDLSTARWEKAESLVFPISPSMESLPSQDLEGM